MSIEVHQALGLKYQRLAVSSVRLKDIITSSEGKVHGKVMLSGVKGLGECVGVGTLDFWMRLKLPITQAIRLYQVRDQKSYIRIYMYIHRNSVIIIHVYSQVATCVYSLSS